MRSRRIEKQGTARSKGTRCAAGKASGALPDVPCRASQAILDRAVPLLNDGKLARGIRTLRQGIRRVPECPWLWCHLAKALCQHGRRRESLAALRRARKFPMASTRLLMAMACEFCCHGKREEELRCAEAAVRLAPELAEAHFNLAGTLHEMGRNCEALVHARMAAQRTPKDARTQELLGVILYNRNRNEEAMEALERAVALDPCLKDAWFNLGLAQLDEDQPELAFKTFLAWSGIVPEEAEGHAFAALAAARSGRREIALHQRREAHRLEKPQDKTRIRRLYREIKEALAEEA